MASFTAPLAVLVFVLILGGAGAFPPITSANDRHGFRASLTHINQRSANYSAAARRDTRRLAFLSYAGAPSNSNLAFHALVENGAGSYSYRMSISIGTPPLTFPAILDTGSDLVWTQCAPCTECFRQPTPLFDPAGSSTFSRLPCTSPLCQSLPSLFRACNATGCVFDYRYVVGFTAGFLAAETLTLGDDAPFFFPDFAFGCSTANGGHMDNASGIVGLGRSPLSLVSQLGIGRFSYCLRSDSDAGASPILFGSLANLTDDGSSTVKIQSTPLVQNPAVRRAPYHYVNLTGVTVGGTNLTVAPSTFGFTRAGGGGVIVDSGTTFTYLAEAGYAMLRQAFLSQATSSGVLTTVSGAPFDFDLCFEALGDVDDVRAVPVPGLVLRFAGGAGYAVPRRSYFDAVDEQGGVACLLVLPTTGGVSVLGNALQMDLHVLYDLDGETLSFAPADCGSV